MQIAELRSGLTPPRIPTRALPEHAGETVRLAGWLHRLRQLGKISFLILRDHTGMAQVVLTEPEQIEQVAALGHESVVEVVGNAVAVPQAPGGVEIHAPAIEVIAAVNEQLPFDLYRPEIAAQLPTVLDHAAVANRHPSRRIYFQLAAALVAGFRTTLDELGFTEIFSPKLVGSATESGANVFALDYFESRAYLDRKSTRLNSSH